MYHHVNTRAGLVTISPDNFSAQMAWLAHHEYHTASCVDLERFLDGEPLPARSVMLTFDDGYLDNYVFAFPILRKYRLRAVVFAVTDWLGDGAVRPLAGEVGQPELLNHRECIERIGAGHPDPVVMRWSEAERTRADGAFEFQSHTASHTRWDKKGTNPFTKASSLADDLARSRKALQERLAIQGTHLCWPQGYFDADYLTVAGEQGFRYLYTTQPGTVTAQTEANRLPRIVAKDKGAAWLSSRLSLYGSPRLAKWYGLLKGR